MDEQRTFSRYSTNQLNARYHMEGIREECKDCTVFNVSRKGLCIKLHTEEGLDEGSIINLTIDVLRAAKPVRVKGIVKWIRRRGDVFLSGVELTRLLDEIEWGNLVYFMSQPK